MFMFGNRTGYAGKRTNNKCHVLCPSATQTKIWNSDRFTLREQRKADVDIPILPACGKKERSNMEGQSISVGPTVRMMAKIFKAKFHLFGLIHNREQHPVYRRLKETVENMIESNPLPLSSPALKEEVAQRARRWRDDMRSSIQNHLETEAQNFYRQLADLDLQAWEGALKMAVKWTVNNLPKYQTHLLEAVTGELEAYCRAIVPNPVPLPPPPEVQRRTPVGTYENKEERGRTKYREYSPGGWPQGRRSARSRQSGEYRNPYKWTRKGYDPRLKTRKSRAESRSWSKEDLHRLPPGGRTPDAGRNPARGSGETTHGEPEVRMEVSAGATPKTQVPRGTTPGKRLPPIPRPLPSPPTVTTENPRDPDGSRREVQMTPQSSAGGTEIPTGDKRSDKLKPSERVSSEQDSGERVSPGQSSGGRVSPTQKVSGLSPILAGFDLGYEDPDGSEDIDLEELFEEDDEYVLME